MPGVASKILEKLQKKFAIKQIRIFDFFSLYVTSWVLKGSLKNQPIFLSYSEELYYIRLHDISSLSLNRKHKEIEFLSQTPIYKSLSQLSRGLQALKHIFNFVSNLSLN